MGDSTTAAAAAPRTQLTRSSETGQEYGDTLGARRPVSDVAGPGADLAEQGPSDPRHRPGPVPEEFEEIPDVEYDASLRTDAEHEGFGAPDRHAR